MAGSTLTRIKLHSWELKHLEEPEGPGGHQGVHRMIVAAFNGTDTADFSDEQLGTIMRHMGYGSGGFQARLRKMFARPFSQLMGLRT